MVTTYEFKPEAGVKYSRVTGLAEDLCLAMRAESILIERMAGKSTVGIQVPNHERETIHLRDVLESETFAKAQVAADAGHGQGHQRPHRHGRSGIDAARADRRFDGIGQIGGHQRHDHEPAVPNDSGAGEADPGRSEARGTGHVRGDSASVYAHHHGAEAGSQCAAQRRARDGAPAEAAGQPQRAQHRPVQQAL